MAIQAISQLRASSKRPSAISAINGHLEAVCRKKARSKAHAVRWIDVLEMVKATPGRHSEVPKLQVPIHINGKAFTLELDTAAGGNFISTRVWTELGKPKLQQAQWHYHWASKHSLPIIRVLPPRPGTAMPACHTQFRFSCPKFPV